jgi:hypothetical protein
MQNPLHSPHHSLLGCQVFAYLDTYLFWDFMASCELLNVVAQISWHF